MPVVTFEGFKVECAPGANLRKVLVKNGIGPYNGLARAMNCHGLGTCGTCAVEVEGGVSEMSPREQLRLSFPPHDPSWILRLACQCRVVGEVTVKKWDGFWGQKVVLHSGGTVDHPTRHSSFSE